MQRNPKKTVKPRLECPSCRKSYSPSQSPHQMNFTKGIVHFHCRSCHREIAQLTFKQWNALHQEQGQPKEEPKKPNIPRKATRFLQSNLPN